jgi:hypothetical protein
MNQFTRNIKELFGEDPECMCSFANDSLATLVMHPIIAGDSCADEWCNLTLTVSPGDNTL